MSKNNQIPQELQKFADFIAEIEAAAYRRGYDAGRQQTYRQRRNNVLHGHGIKAIRNTLIELRRQLDGAIDSYDM